VCTHAPILPCPEIESLLLGACHVWTVAQQGVDRLTATFCCGLQNADEVRLRLKMIGVSTRMTAAGLTTHKIANY